MNRMNIQEKIRTVNIGTRGQLVIPEDIRKDLGIKGETTLVLIEKGSELVLKKESNAIKAIEGEDVFWRELSKESLKRAWHKEDKIWDELHRATE